MVNNKDNRVVISRNHRSDSCPLEIDVLKTSILSLEASLIGQYLFEQHQISARQLLADSSSTGTLYCLNINLALLTINC